MKTKVLAIALAGIAGAPMLASAQSASVTLYGRLYPEINFARMTGPTAPGSGVSTLTGPPTGESFGTITKLDASNSRFGLRGSEYFGNGWAAFFQVEQRVLIDTGNPGNTGIASRDTYAGLQSADWGLVRLGNMDTVYKNLGDSLSFLGVSSGNFVSNSNVLSKQGFGTNSAGSFHLRRGNSVWYETPQYRGFQALVQYSPDEAKTPSRNAYLVSTGVKYDNGPIYAALAYELHNDTFGGSRNVPSALSNVNDLNARSKDTGIRLTGQYRFALFGGDQTVEGDVAEIEYKESGGKNGRFQKYRHTTYAIGLDSKWNGPWRTAIAYTAASAGSCSLFGGVLPCNTSGLDGKQFAVGASYSFSPRTAVFALVAKLWNGHSGQYNNLDGSDAAIGADIQQIALGILHNF